MNNFLKKIKNSLVSVKDFLIEKKWVLVKGGAYGAVVLLFYVIFLWFLFPYHEAVTRLSDELKNKTSMEVTVRKAGGAFPLGLNLSDVVVTEKIGTHESPLLEARTIKIVPGILSLLRGWVSLKVYARLYNGQAWIDFSSNKTDFNLNGVIKDIYIDKYTLIKSNYGLNMDGILDAKLDIKGNLNDVTKDKGSGFINMKHIILKPSKIFGIFALPNTNFGDINLPVFIKNGQVSLQDAAQTGSDINSKLNGSIILLNPIGSSVLNLSLQFNPSPALEEQIKKTIPFFNLTRDSSGYFNVPITGNLNMPRFE
jgi:type II secretion system protein N